MKKPLWILSFICLSVMFGVVAVILGNADNIFLKEKTVSAKNNSITPLVVIDPGHGGEDGGCVAFDGTVEKDLNLQMSKNLCDMLNAMGVPSIMTREEDKLLYDIYKDTPVQKGKKKILDLRNRLRFTEESGAMYLISIHMNKYPNEKYKGCQVYYSTNSEGSTILADAIQNNVKKYLQKDNNRLIKKAGSNIYILDRAKITSVLCECGFLSNKEETSLLKNENYRKKLSLCIACAIIDRVCDEKIK